MESNFFQFVHDANIAIHPYIASPQTFPAREMLARFSCIAAGVFDSAVAGRRWISPLGIACKR